MINIDDLPLKEVRKIFQRRKEGRTKIIGEVEFHREYYSNFLHNKRDVFVWLPPSYRNSNKRYPVLYMHDGQNIMDPKTSFAGADWRVDETVSKLIKQKKMKEIIIVGINNTNDRLDEYSDTEKGNNYIKFLLEELKPFIDSAYRTMPENNNAAVMGSSMGGLISFLIVWNNSHVIKNAACLSSSFYFHEDKAIKNVKESSDKKDVRIYIDHGEDGLDEGQRMFSALTEKGYKLGKELDYFYAPRAQHTEAEWAKRLERPLLFLFGKD